MDYDPNYDEDLYGNPTYVGSGDGIYGYHPYGEPVELDDEDEDVQQETVYQFENYRVIMPADFDDSIRIIVSADVDDADARAVRLHAMSLLDEIPEYDGRETALGPYVEEPRDSTAAVRMLPRGQNAFERLPGFTYIVIHNIAQDPDWLTATEGGIAAQSVMNYSDFHAILGFFGRNEFIRMFSGNYSDAWSNEPIDATRPVLNIRRQPVAAGFLYDYGYSDISPVVTLAGTWNTFDFVGDNDARTLINTMHSLRHVNLQPAFTIEGGHLHQPDDGGWVTSTRRIVARVERFNTRDDILSYLLLTTAWGRTIARSMNLQNFVHLFTNTPYDESVFRTPHGSTIADLTDAAVEQFHDRIDELFPTVGDRELFDIAAGTYVRELLDSIGV